MILLQRKRDFFRNRPVAAVPWVFASPHPQRVPIQRRSIVAGLHVETEVVDGGVSRNPPQDDDVEFLS